MLGVAIGTAYTFRDEIGQVFAAVGEFIMGAFEPLLSFIDNTFIQPAMDAVRSLHDFFVSVFEAIGGAIRAPLEAAINAVKSTLNIVIQGVASGINSAIQFINRVISGANRLPNVNIPLIPTISIPEFAEGGMVTGPTLGLVGEAGPEYIVPARKAEAFAQNYLAGIRGPAAIPRFAEGGFVAPANANVSIQTGPVTQMNGQNFVTANDMSAAVQSGVEQTLELIRRDGMIRAGLAI